MLRGIALRPEMLAEPGVIPRDALVETGLRRFSKAVTVLGSGRVVSLHAGKVLLSNPESLTEPLLAELGRRRRLEPLPAGLAARRVSFHLGWACLDFSVGPDRRVRTGRHLGRHEALGNIVSAARTVAGRLGEAALENLPPFPEEGGRFVYEPEFVAETVRLSGARLLLDLGHVRVACSWLGLDPLEHVGRLPLDRVVEVHVSGPAPGEDGRLRDAHGSLAKEDLDLLEKALRRLGPGLLILEYHGPLEKLGAEWARVREVRVVEPGLERATDGRPGLERHSRGGVGLDPVGVAALVSGRLQPGGPASGDRMTGPLTVGISSTTWQLQGTLTLAREFRCRGLRVLVVASGHGPRLDPASYLAPDSSLDAVVLGEEEEPFRALCGYARHLASAGGGVGSLPAIPGVVWRTPEGPQGEPPAPRPADLSRLPFMARDILERKFETFSGFEVGASIVSGWGCFSHCAYCSISAYLDRQPGPRFRQPAVEDIVAEIAQLHSPYGVVRFNFEDDNFLVPGRAGAARAPVFAQTCEVFDFRPRFFIQTRPDQVTEEALRPLLGAGLEDLNVGIEAVAPEDLELFNRGGTPDDAERCLAVLDRLIEAARVRDWPVAPGEAAARARADLAAEAANQEYREACVLADEIARPEAGVDGWR